MGTFVVWVCKQARQYEGGARISKAKQTCVFPKEKEIIAEGNLSRRLYPMVYSVTLC